MLDSTSANKKAEALVPNRNYVNGVAYERKAKKFLEEQGYTVIRAAGSHGFADLIAFRGNEKVRCIQIKRTKTPLGVKQLLAKFKPAADTSYTDELWIWSQGKWTFAPAKDTLPTT